MSTITDTLGLMLEKFYKPTDKPPKINPKIYSNQVNIGGSMKATSISSMTTQSSLAGQVSFGPSMIKTAEMEVLCENCWSSTILKAPQGSEHCPACLGKKIQPTPKTELDFQAAWGIPRALTPAEHATVEEIKAIKEFTSDEERQLMKAVMLPVMNQKLSEIQMSYQTAISTKASK